MQQKNRLDISYNLCQHDQLCQSNNLLNIPKEENRITGISKVLLQVVLQKKTKTNKQKNNLDYTVQG